MLHTIPIALSLRAIALAVLAQLWPPAMPRTPETPAILEALVTAVEADDYEPALGSRELDVAAGVVFAFDESALHEKAAGDCYDIRDGRGVHGYPDGRGVPRTVVCRAAGAWQMQSLYGRADLTTQAQAWLRMLRASVAECPAHPAANLVSGARGCSRGTKLSDWRLWRARKFLSVAEDRVPHDEVAAAVH